MTAFARFNVVGLAGFGVQLVVLTALAAVGVPAFLATCLGVEAAILHNFAWHERWTWPDLPKGDRARRLGRFHAANGLISIAGNPAITTALVTAGASLVAANLAAVAACALVNYAAARLWVCALAQLDSSSVR